MIEGERTGRVAGRGPDDRTARADRRDDATTPEPTTRAAEIDGTEDRRDAPNATTGRGTGTARRSELAGDRTPADKGTHGVTTPKTRSPPRGEPGRPRRPTAAGLQDPAVTRPKADPVGDRAPITTDRTRTAVRMKLPERRDRPGRRASRKPADSRRRKRNHRPADSRRQKRNRRPATERRDGQPASSREGRAGAVNPVRTRSTVPAAARSSRSVPRSVPTAASVSRPRHRLPLARRPRGVPLPAVGAAAVLPAAECRRCGNESCRRSPGRTRRP
ncbi:hypothetical protein SAMN05216564_106213 [Halopenitus persicus]|uniref:Uncharacterized protein n=1 Tax=Halopenitus persicus TaxID=1048396 RepID=A0A1H3KYD2_9EURY|nr:hypothetical protein SAMN05216564_106213 [Halopenitus persicus]